MTERIFTSLQTNQKQFSNPFFYSFLLCRKSNALKPLTMSSGCENENVFQCKNRSEIIFQQSEHSFPSWGDEKLASAWVCDCCCCTLALYSLCIRLACGAGVCWGCARHIVFNENTNTQTHKAVAVVNAASRTILKASFHSAWKTISLCYAPPAHTSEQTNSEMRLKLEKLTIKMYMKSAHTTKPKSLDDDDDVLFNMLLESFSRSGWACNRLGKESFFATFFQFIQKNMLRMLQSRESERYKMKSTTVWRWKSTIKRF